MGIDTMHETAAQYRLLYMQPDPEVGENICVAVMFGDDLLFDPTFSKVKCLTREWRPGLLRLYMNEIRMTLLRDTSNFEVSIKRFAPLFSASRPRYLATPVAPETKVALYQAYVANRSTLDAAARRRESFVEHVNRFVTARELPPSTEVIANATGREVLGRTKVSVRPVALALKGLAQTVLVDGIDLNLDSAKIAIQQAGRITHTFWQYRLYGAEQNKNIKRVALVFNGNSHKKADLRDAHDFAFQQFQTESDIVIDAASEDADRQVQGFLEHYLGR
ncbi:hypothetical protein [Granulicella tundricola]|uniref:DUF3037 domain-containing protein n=1 Tax=Granulicella tundricola (strain ATCC BAA-1859 / DSM 23138 / MP5ACTX9) TaxID=1198114 RepID=E8WW42_GRATM|nr:hypothetical protein [Granulicella tundricola]ADW67348.1 hypothetical protein AciX9_0276 [Granulicella tundricola MP5ACTX9]